MAALSKTQIKQAVDSASEEVHVPEWGGSLFVRTLTSKERVGFELWLSPDSDKLKEKRRKQLKERLIVLCACDENGDSIFDESDLGWLAEKAAKPVDRVFEAARKLNGIGVDDIEELEGNSDAALNDDSPSD